MHKVLHISNTDIRSDYRIIRQLYSLRKYDLYTIGISDDNESHGINLDDVSKNFFIKTFGLFNKFAIVKHFINFIYFNILSFLLIFKIKPNLIHVHDTYPLISCAIYKFIYKPILIYDCHELESQKSSQNYLLGKFTYLIELVFYKYCDCLITVSSSIEEWYANNLGRLDEHLVLYNSPKIKSSNTSILNRVSINDADQIKKFVYVGQFSSGRHILELLNLFSKSIHECHFIGWGHFESKIKIYSDNHDNIFYKPAIPNDLLIDFLSNSDFDFGLCLLSPISLSDELSLPNKIFEYSFSGINVVASNFSEIDSFIKDVNGGYTVHDLLDFKNKLDNNLFQQKVMDTNSLEKYSYSKMSQALCGLYLKLLK